MNTFAKFSFLALVAAPLAACAAQTDMPAGDDTAQATGHDEAHATGSIGQALGNPNGGHGGDSLRCPSVTGFTGRAGTYVDALGLLCGGPSMDQRWSTQRYGGGGGHEIGNVSCPNGYFAIGLFGTNGEYIDSMGLHCSDGVNVWDSPKVGGDAPNPGGSPYDFWCPADQKLVGFDVRDGEYIDYLGPICAPRLGGEEGPNYCNDYASSAVAQNNENLSLKCGYERQDGAEWQSNFSAHYEWCRTADPQWITGARADRESKLEVCRSVHLGNNRRFSL